MQAPDDHDDGAVTPASDATGGGPPVATAIAGAPPVSAPRVGVMWWLSLAILCGDQLSKALVRNAVSPFESRPVIPGLVDLAHVRNEGMAFGLLNAVNLPRKWILTTALALAALGGITYFARHIQPNERLARIGLSMIFGGAIGNLIDRLRAGYVFDFVDVYWRDWHFWTFNVADASISIGAVLVFIDMLLVKRHASHSV